MRFFVLLIADTGITAIALNHQLKKKKNLLMGALSKISDVNHIITIGFVTCFTASSCKEHPIVPRVFVKDWLGRNERVLYFVLNLYFLVYIYPRFLSYEEQLSL